MNLDEKLKPFARHLVIPSDADLTAFAAHRERLRVTEDYMDVFKSGFLSLDLDKDVPVEWRKVEGNTWLAGDISTLGQASSVTSEGLPEALDDHFYVVGQTYGGGLVVQISAGPHRGKLALIEDSALGELEVLKELPEPVIEGLVKASMLEIGDMTLLDYVELRLANAEKPRPRVSLDTEAKIQQALAKAFKKITKHGHLELRGLGDFELTESLGDLSTIAGVKLVECELARLPDSLAELPNLKRLLLEDCPNLSELPGWVSDKIAVLFIERCPLRALPTSLSAVNRLSIKNCAIRELPATLPVVESISLDGCPVEALPHLARYEFLTSLKVENAPLAQLPEDLGDLLLLEELRIAGCPDLTVLPDAICRLQELKTLEIYDTGLSRLPERIGELRTLTRLVLGSWGSNQLESLPDSLCDLEQLRLLWLANNRLTSLPGRIGTLKNLTMLSLDNNQLTSLPESLFDLKPFTLKNELTFHDNPIPAELVKQYRARIKALG